MARVVEEPAGGINHRRSAVNFQQTGQSRPAIRSPLSRTAFYNTSCQEFIVSNLLGSYNQTSPTPQSTSNGKNRTPQSLRHALPISRYRESLTKNDASKRQRSPKGQQCIICLEDFRKNQLIQWLPCVHTFHVNCIDSWLRNSTKCPVCQCDVQHPTSTPTPNTLNSIQKISMPDQTHRLELNDGGIIGNSTLSNRRLIAAEEIPSHRRRQPTISASKLIQYAGASAWMPLNMTIDRRKMVHSVAGG